MGHRRRKRTDVVAVTVEQTDSHLLSLPPEIRDIIYELVCTNVEKATLTCDPGIGIHGISNPLSQTCRQLRAEFSWIYKARAGDYASELVCNIKNFKLPSRSKGMVRWVLNNLAPLANGQVRTFTQKLFLDNTFDHQFYAAHPSASLFMPQPRASLDPNEERQEFDPCFVIRFDSRTFDVAYLRNFMTKYTDRRPGTKHIELWLAVEKAIEDHEARRADAARSRKAKKRSRTKTKAAASAEKS